MHEVENTLPDNYRIVPNFLGGLMETINYKSIPAVPTSKNFIDASLSKTQRKTPTVVHKGYDIVRIRNFYMRKVKFTQQTFHEKLEALVEAFPKIDNTHPFYADLINVLYDRDHYKIALGKINAAKGSIDRVAQEYTRLLKFGDSLYRCKTLKRIALGRMTTLVKKLDKSLVYLEQVRQHLSRLPTIDPTARTLLLCGFPNVGKSSFMNSVTRAEVEVQPYAFTTKSLYVGQTDYKYLRFQVIDTPGILDQPLEDRNTIEMQAITALAHLKAAIIFMMDISETCGYSLEQQLQLFDNLAPLFSTKTLIIGLNKTDVVPVSSICESHRKLLATLEARGIVVCPLSTLSTEGVMELRNRACDMLLAQRDATTNSKRTPALANRLHVSMPKNYNPLARVPIIPQKLAQDVAEGKVGLKRPTQKELKEKLGEDYVFDEKTQYLVDEYCKFDVIPEIMDGKNIADFVDPDIEAKLAALEHEECLREEAGYYRVSKWSDLEIKAYLDCKGVTEARQLAMAEHGMRRSSSHPRLSKIITSKVEKFTRKGPNRAKQLVQVDVLSEDEQEGEPIMDGPLSSNYEKRLLHSGVTKHRMAECKKSVRSARKQGNRLARAGEGDRRIYNLMPKHLYAGKRKGGKTQRR